MITTVYDIINNSIYVLMSYLFSGVFLKKRQSKAKDFLFKFFLWIVADNFAVNFMTDHMVLKALSTIMLSTLFTLWIFDSALVITVSVQIAFSGLSAITESGVLFVLGKVFDKNNINVILNSNLYFIGGMISQMLIFVVIVILSRIMKKDSFSELKDGEWLLIMIMPLFTICITLGIFYAFNGILNELQVNVLSLIVLGLLFLNVSQYYLIRNLALKESLLTESRIITERARTTNQLYDQLAKDREKRKAKDHDMIKLLTTAVAMARDTGDDDLTSYLTENLEITESHMDVFDCGNSVINALINTKYNEARRKDIPINYVISDLSHITLPNADIVSVIANMLDNAIEASVICEREKRWIRFKALIENDVLYIGCENSYINKLVTNDKGFETSKSGSDHGYGILNINLTVKKHNGSFNVSTDNNIFRIMASIPIS